MNEDIHKLISGHDAIVGCFVLPMFRRNFNPIVINGHERFPMGSVIKFFIMIEVLMQCQEGRLKLSDELSVPWKIPLQRTSILCHLKSGRSLSIKELVSFMIACSDSYAADILIEKVGLDSIANRVSRLGLRETSIDLSILALNMGFSGILDSEHADLNWGEYFRLLQSGSLNTISTADNFQYRNVNYTTPNDTGRILTLLAKGELLNKEHTLLATDLMACQYSRVRIPAKLPFGIMAEHVIGTIIDNDGLCCANDCGYLKKHDERLVICLLAKEISGDYSKIDSLFADVARIICEKLWKF